MYNEIILLIMGIHAFYLFKQALHTPPPRHSDSRAPFSIVSKEVMKSRKSGIFEKEFIHSKTYSRPVNAVYM
jgi:hypothetical protein